MSGQVRPEPPLPTGLPEEIAAKMAPFWERVRALRASVASDDLNCGVPGFRPVYSSDARFVAGMLGTAIDRLEEELGVEPERRTNQLDQPGFEPTEPGPVPQ